MSWAGLYTAVSGLNAQRLSLQTISHNIANSDDENYVRQSALHANDYYTTGVPINQKVGRGVKISEIRQIRDEFLDIRYRIETGPYGFYKAKDEVLEDVEAVFREKSNEGILGVMETFWSNANELVKNPSSLTIRGLVHESGVAVATTFNSLARQLENSKRNLNNRIYNQIDRANAILEQVKAENLRVKGQEIANPKYSMNDVRDRRNALIDELSELLPIEAIKNYNGEVLIYVEGRMMVGGDYVNHIVPKIDNHGFFHPVFEDTLEPMLLRGHGGMGGVMEVRDRSIPEYEYRLNDYARKFASAVNKIHREARGLPTDADPLGSTNNSFFIDKSLTGDPAKYNSEEGDRYINAKNLAMNPDLANLNLIATSYSGLIEDATAFQDIIQIRMTMDNMKKPYVARELEREVANQYFLDGITRYNPSTNRYEGITLEELKPEHRNKTDAEIEALREPIYQEFNKKLEKLGEDPLNRVSVDEYYRDIITAIGIERESAIMIKDAQFALMKGIDDKRTQISGVSLDEEMTNVIKFQHAYTANTRVVNVIDEMLDQIVNRVGIVGR